MAGDGVVVILVSLENVTLQESLSSFVSYVVGADKGEQKLLPAVEHDLRQSASSPYLKGKLTKGNRQSDSTIDTV